VDLLFYTLTTTSNCLAKESVRYVICPLNGISVVTTVCTGCWDKGSGPSAWGAGPPGEIGKGWEYTERQASSSCSNRCYLEVCHQSRECPQTEWPSDNYYTCITPSGWEWGGKVSSVQEQQRSWSGTHSYNYLIALAAAVNTLNEYKKNQQQKGAFCFGVHILYTYYCLKFCKLICLYVHLLQIKIYFIFH